jgi:hypothetical protein
MEGGEKKHEGEDGVNGVSLGQGKECRRGEIEVGMSSLDHANVREGWGVEGVDGCGVAWQTRLRVLQQKERVEVDPPAR